jgi:hypothetical protein
MCEERMIKRTAMVFAAMLACFSGGAWANDCQIMLTQPVVDYGAFNPHTLKATAKSSLASLGKRVMQLNVMCADARNMAVTFHGVASGLESYQLSDKGEFDLTLKDAHLDGELVLLGSVSSVGEVPNESRNAVKLRPGKYLVPVLHQQLKTGKTLSVSVELDARLFVDGLNIRDAVIFEGQGNFEVTP